MTANCYADQLNCQFYYTSQDAISTLETTAKNALHNTLLKAITLNTPQMHAISFTYFQKRLVEVQFIEFGNNFCNSVIQLGRIVHMQKHPT